MKTTLFALLMLAVSPVAMAEAPTVVTATSPVVEAGGSVEILMADGSARRVRKILGVTPDALRIMTDEGIGKIPLKSLHPAALTALNSMQETPEEFQARKQREATAAASYRENQAAKERLAAQENSTMGANQRAEAGRQELARQQAAQAAVVQQAAFKEMQKEKEVHLAARKAEREAARAADERAAERQRQYELQVAAVQAAQMQAQALQAQAQAAQQQAQVAKVREQQREAEVKRQQSLDAAAVRALQGLDNSVRQEVGRRR